MEKELNVSQQACSLKPVACSLVLGAGAVGSLFGGHLAARGVDVSLLGRDPHISAIRENGLKLTDVSGVWGDRHANVFRELLTDIRDRKTPAFDLVIITTRTKDTVSAARLAKDVLAPNGHVISIQNGIGNWEAIAAEVGWHRVIGGVMNTGVGVVAPGHVHVTVQGFPTNIARPPHPKCTDDRFVEQLVAEWKSLGMPVVQPPDIRAVQWRKLIYNCALNALATVRGGKYSLLLGEPAARADQEAIIRECFAVANAHGIAVDIPSVDEYFRWFFDDVFPRTADHEPSMLSHLRSGKHTEIDAINGTVARLGAEKGVATPVNAAYTKQIHELEVQAVKA